MGTSSVESFTTRMPSFEQNQIRTEPMLDDCDALHVSRLGGPITQAFVDRLPEDWRANPTLAIDSWVTRLKAGWYPCRPGWQFAGKPTTSFIVGMVNGEAAHVEFAVGKYPTPVESIAMLRQDEIDAVVEELIRLKKLQRWVPRADRFMLYGDEAIYQCLPAEAAGWRWTGRAAIYSYKRTPANERVRQTQVYVK